MLQPRTLRLKGAVAAVEQQQLLPCLLASLSSLAETLQAAATQPLQQCTQQQLQQHELSMLPLQQACSPHTQQQMLLVLQASAAAQHVQWPSLFAPTQSIVGATQWCRNQKHQTRLWSSSSSSHYAVLQQMRNMHSTAAGIQEQLLQAGSPAVNESSANSTSSSKHEAGADPQQQQLQTFEDMGLPEPLLAALKAQGFTAPTPVQVAALPVIFSGRNVALQSATGTGKTLAYLLPLLSELQSWVPGKNPPRHGKVLVMCPTQELCMQVLRAARDLLPSHRTKVQPLVGGANPLSQLMALKEHKPHIVVATPGRLLKVIHKGGAFTNAFPLAAKSSADGRREHRMVLVLEEADKLLAMSDTVQVLRLLTARLTNNRNTLELYARHCKAAKGHTRKTRFARVPDVDSGDALDDVDSQGVPQMRQDVNFMRTVLNTYQVLLVSAGLKPSTLASAPAWAETKPIMIAAAPPVAPVALPAVPTELASSRPRDPRKKYCDTSNSGLDGIAASSSSSSSDDVPGDGSSSVEEQQRRRLLEMGLPHDDKGLSKGVIGLRVERALMLPEHIQHQVLLYPATGDILKYLTRCLNHFLRQGCKALVFVGQRQNVWELQQRVQRSRQLKAELGCLHSGLEPDKKQAQLRRFNRGELRALLLTDAYGLGMDFKDVDVVLGVESLPAGVQQYMRRAGRTGRMGRPGTVLSIIPDKRMEAIKKTLKRLFITPQEMVLQQQDPSIGGGWTIEPKYAAEAILAGEGPPEKHKKHERQQQQQPQQQQGVQELRPWGRRAKRPRAPSSSSSTATSGSSFRLSKPSRKQLFSRGGQHGMEGEGVS